MNKSHKRNATLSFEDPVSLCSFNILQTNDTVNTLFILPPIVTILLSLAPFWHHDLFCSQEVKPSVFKLH
jgi:hypothetical protein